MCLYHQLQLIILSLYKIYKHFFTHFVFVFFETIIFTDYCRVALCFFPDSGKVLSCKINSSLIKLIKIKHISRLAFCRLIFILVIIFGSSTTAIAQDSIFRSKHAAIIFPYPMYKEKWRASIGFTLLALPEDITEETQLRLPCGDLHVLRRLNNQFILNMRVAFQFLQNHLSAGVSWVRPISHKLFFSVGDDVGYWFGFLEVQSLSFNSTGHGWLNYPNVSAGFKTKKNLLITLRGEAGVNLFYKSSVGDESFSSGEKFYNGESFTLAFEQPFYGKKHLTLAFSAINNYFYWQTWALFYKTDRKIFYPQITIGFIL